jgi:hypothetical protein
VLRRFVDEEGRAEEPDAPRIEATALTVAASLPLPTPGLVALGETDAIPMLLMTRLPGSLVWQPADCGGWPPSFLSCTLSPSTPSSRRTSPMP